VVRDLRTPSKQLADATPDLTTTFQMLNHLFDLIGYNQNGREAPTPTGRDEGYLFWIAWLGHNAGAVFSTADATGIFRPVAIQATCATIKQTVADEPQLEFLQGLTGALLDRRICPAG
jgi:phospholipid/cholesterol/gamma-HCH transport system substrate-binding protein